MKALTVQQPWAWAIMHGGKSVENRSTRWQYRGPLAIHAGKGWAGDDALSKVEQLTDTRLLPGGFILGAILGVVDLIDVHDCLSTACTCGRNPWAERAVNASGYFPLHLVLANPRPVRSIPCKGALGLWTVPTDIARALDELPPGATD